MWDSYTVAGIISKEARICADYEFVKCFLLAVAEKVNQDKRKILQDVSLEAVQGLYMNLERLCLNSVNCRQSPFIVHSQWMKEITS
jgi:hypothetical protein